MHDRRPVVPEGLTSQTRQLAVREQVSRKGSRRTRLVLGLGWCFLGSIFAIVVPILANVLIAFGVVVATESEDRRTWVLTLLATTLVGGVGAFALYGMDGLPLVVLSVLTACVLARGYVKGWLDAGGLMAVAAALALVMIGVDTMTLSSQGSTIVDAYTDMVNQAMGARAGSLDLEEETILLETKSLLVAYWPTMYFVVGLGMALCSLVGSWLGARASGVLASRGFFRYFDVPLWVAELFAIGVVAQLLGPHLPSWHDEVAMVGANVVACCRFALAQQGISVLTWRMCERQVPLVVRILAVLAAVWLELSFALTSVVGLADVIFNFRRIPRRRPDLVLRPASER